MPPSHVIEEKISMSNIARAFENGKAFIPFITCGDPDLETTEQLVYALERAGADLIELGIPFSDPTAEGPVIQEANVRSLTQGTTTDKVFDLVERIRKNTSIPLVFMTYANVVFSYGTERFIRKSEEFELPFAKVGIDRIPMIAPTSHERISAIAKNAHGFVYCVSSLGVTGVRSRITTDVGAMVKLVKQQQSIPCAIGFGIATPEQAQAMARVSDGAIVGSAIVKLCAQYGKDCVPYVESYVRTMKEAVLQA